MFATPVHNQAALKLVKQHSLDGSKRDAVLYLLGRMMLNCPEAWESFPYWFRFRVVHSCAIAYRRNHLRLQ